MRCIDRPLAEVAILQMHDHADRRGCIREVFRESEFSEIVGRQVKFVQLNTIQAIRHSARGLHYDSSGRQGKLVFAVTGSHFSVAVDVREGSPTVGGWASCFLGASRLALWVPPGFAHGTMCLETGVLQYLSTEEYNPSRARSLAIDGLTIGWPVPLKECVIKDDDFKVRTLEEFWRSL